MMAVKTAMFLLLLLAAEAFAQTVEMKTASASCRVDLEGARILSFRVRGSEMLWNDDPPQTKASDWAHGGIPVCWPCFGPGSDGSIHGTAWRRTFSLRSRMESDRRSEMLLELRQGDVRLEYSIVVTDVLVLEMTTVNGGTNDFRCSFGFHPYFLAGERDMASVEGVDGLPFEDDPSVGRRMKGVWRGPVRMSKTIDRIFALPGATAGMFVMRDPAKNRSVSLECSGASHLNIWNPGAEKQCPGFVPGDEWRRFVCVEPLASGTGSAKHVVIAPSERRTLKMVVRKDD